MQGEFVYSCFETPKNEEYGIKCLKHTVNCSYMLKLSAQWEILESHALADMGISFPLLPQW